MTTRQELFERCLMFQAGLLVFGAHLTDGFVDTDPHGIARGVRLERKLDDCPSKRFTRACNFVARQLGIWEER